MVGGSTTVAATSSANCAAAANSACSADDGSYWCARRLPPEAWLIFLDDLLAGVYRVEPPTGTDLARCRELQARYADLTLGVVDASVVALAERLGESKVATLDQRHFRAVRPTHLDALELRP